MFTSVAIGSIPRMGKTFALRELLLMGALDPRAELHAYDLKGTGDLDPLRLVAYRYRSGDDPEDIAYLLADLREQAAELRRRAKVIRELPPELCPENKVTPELASKRSLRLHPIEIGLDECQRAFEHPEYGAEITAICIDLVRRGPALGIILIVATQRPDKDSLPTGISANVSTRFCLKVMSHIENDMVLGTGAHKAGVRATMFAWADKGIGYLLGEASDARIVRTPYTDRAAALVITTRARVLREQAGRLDGYAAGHDQSTLDLEAPGSGTRLLRDVLAVVPASEAKVWNETVVARLAELRPEVYGGWEPEQLTAALKPFGITTGQVWGSTDDGRGANRRGITRDHVTGALTERERKGGGDGPPLAR